MTNPPPRPQGERTLRWSERSVDGWDGLQMSEGRHGQRAIFFAVATGLLLVTGAVVDQLFLALGVVAGLFALIEWAMWRRSRPRSRLPDHRPAKHGDGTDAGRR